MPQLDWNDHFYFDHRSEIRHTHICWNTWILDQIHNLLHLILMRRIHQSGWLFITPAETCVTVRCVTNKIRVKSASKIELNTEYFLLSFSFSINQRTLKSNLTAASSARSRRATRDENALLHLPPHKTTHKKGNVSPPNHDELHLEAWRFLFASF